MTILHPFLAGRMGQRWVIGLLVLLLSTFFSSAVIAQIWLEKSYSFIIKVENWEGGRILLVDLTLGEESEETTFVLGKVLSPATELRTQSFRATAYGKSSCVIASSVNSIHIKVYSEKDIGKGASFAIFPLEYYLKNYKGETATPVRSVIYTDIRSGAYLFGGSFSPPPGSEVLVLRNGKKQSLTFGFAPKTGDVFLIHVEEPDVPVSKVVFENREGGLVIVEKTNGTREAVASVMKAVGGVGRFIGSELASPGSIRAVHSAVIEISTSRKGYRGAFQIIPASHAISPELLKSLLLPQYMLLRPLKDQELEGSPPLFSLFLFPYAAERVESDPVNLKGQEVPLETLGRVPDVEVLADFGEGLVHFPIAEGRKESNRNALLLIFHFISFWF